MKKYNASCPCCGHRNNSLYLDETEGWMECEKCGELAQVSKYLKKRVKISRPHLMIGSHVSYGCSQSQMRKFCKVNAFCNYPYKGICERQMFPFAGGGEYI